MYGAIRWVPATARYHAPRFTCPNLAPFLNLGPKGLAFEIAA
ncbi:hypothetical protein ACFONL_13280 [Camelimonas fluminis]|uniref:Uncharacterized protein n=1 Tax=Camelimonas fluminis TaxID=1576911 RepID=A0ABV7UIU8_9HYPH|nr:hypothetical protein [Camelimonas fluminis]